MLPNVVCFNCNKPVAHLYDQYQQLVMMGYPREDIFTMLDVNNYCCRHQLSQSQVMVMKKQDNQKILGQYKNIKKPSITPLMIPSDDAVIQLNRYGSGIPQEYKIGSPNVLNDHLMIHHVSEATYLAL